MAKTKLLLEEFIKFDYLKEEYLVEALAEYLNMVNSGKLLAPNEEAVVVSQAFRQLRQMAFALQNNAEATIIKSGQDVANIKALFNKSLNIAKTNKDLIKVNHYTDLHEWLGKQQIAFTTAEGSGAPFVPQSFQEFSAPAPPVAPPPPARVAQFAPPRIGPHSPGGGAYGLPGKKIR